jgi:hypothetical protein
VSDSIRASIQDEKLAVKILERDSVLWMELTDRVAQRVWAPTPLLKLEVHDKRLRREERVDKYRIEALEVWDTGAHVTVSDSLYGVTVGVWFGLVSGELSVRFSTAEAYDRDPVLYRLFSVDVLPGLMKVTGESGRLLLPINGATLCRPANKPPVADRFMIFVEQPRWELATLLPIAAAWDKRSGLMALATQAAAEAQCRVATDGKGAGQVGFAFVLRQRWVDPVEPAEREFRFVPIPPKAEPVTFMSKRLRRHVMEDLKKPTLKQRAEESPEIAYKLRTMTIKLFHGIQNQGSCFADTHDLPPSHFHNLMMFDEAATCLRKLHAAGIPRLYTQSVGWNARGHDGLYPTRFPIEPRLGGEDRFRELVRTATALGYQANVHDNYQNNYPSSPDWDTECIIQDPDGAPLVRGFWAGGVEYASWPPAFPEWRRGQHMRRVKALGLQGMGYCDNWFAPLEINYHPRYRGTRSDHMRGIQEILLEVKRVHGAVGTEFGSLPGALVCDSTCIGVPTGYQYAIRANPHWPVAGLLDDPLPVWGLALHGLTMHEAMGGPTWTNAMTAVAFGASVRDEWGVRPNNVGGIAVFSDRRVAALRALHDLCVETFGHLQAEELMRCEMSPDFQQVRSAFADGTEVSADLATKELIVNRKRIERPAALLDQHHD